jgi:quinol monooxygenase YgiN
MRTTLIILASCYTFLFTSCGKNQTSEIMNENSAAIQDTTSRVIIAELVLKPERIADFIEAARPLVDSSRTESGCESYTLYQNPHDLTRFAFIEVWKDQAAIDAHFQKKYFTEFGPKTNEWMAQPTVLKIFDASAQQ